MWTPTLKSRRACGYLRTHGGSNTEGVSTSALEMHSSNYLPKSAVSKKVRDVRTGSTSDISLSNGGVNSYLLSRDLRAPMGSEDGLMAPTLNYMAAAKPILQPTKCPEINDEQLVEIYKWMDDIPLTRPKRNISRDFSDGVLMAEVVKFCLPKIPPIESIRPASSSLRKRENWEALNDQAFRRIGFILHVHDIEDAIGGKGFGIQRILHYFRKQANAYLRRKAAQPPPAPPVVIRRKNSFASFHRDAMLARATAVETDNIQGLESPKLSPEGAVRCGTRNGLNAAPLPQSQYASNESPHMHPQPVFSERGSVSTLHDPPQKPWTRGASKAEDVEVAEALPLGSSYEALLARAPVAEHNQASKQGRRQEVRSSDRCLRVEAVSEVQLPSSEEAALRQLAEKRASSEDCSEGERQVERREKATQQAKSLQERLIEAISSKKEIEDVFLEEETRAEDLTEADESRDEAEDQLMLEEEVKHDDLIEIEKAREVAYARRTLKPPAAHKSEGIPEELQKKILVEKFSASNPFPSVSGSDTLLEPSSCSTASNLETIKAEKAQLLEESKGCGIAEKTVSSWSSSPPNAEDSGIDTHTTLVETVDLHLHSSSNETTHLKKGTELVSLSAGIESNEYIVTLSQATPTFSGLGVTLEDENKSLQSPAEPLNAAETLSEEDSGSYSHSLRGPSLKLGESVFPNSYFSLSSHFEREGEHTHTFHSQASGEDERMKNEERKEWKGGEGLASEPHGSFGVAVNVVEADDRKDTVDFIKEYYSFIEELEDIIKGFGPLELPKEVAETVASTKMMSPERARSRKLVAMLKAWGDRIKQFETSLERKIPPPGNDY